VGIQLVVNVPELLVVPVTVVAIRPPLIVTVAPATAVLLEFRTVTLILPAVLRGILRVEVAPPFTPTCRVCARYPEATAVIDCVPAVTFESE
jgi:hypothetical protein